MNGIFYLLTLTAVILPDYVAIPIYILLAVLSSASITLYVIGKRLEKSNSIGDEEIEYNNYGTDPDYHASANKISGERIRSFMAEYAKNPFSSDGAKVWDNDPNDDIYGDLPEVDIPLFAPPES